MCLKRYDIDSLLCILRIASTNIPLMSTVFILWHCIFCNSWGTVFVTTTWNSHTQSLPKYLERRRLHKQCCPRAVSSRSILLVIWLVVVAINTASEGTPSFSCWTWIYPAFTNSVDPDQWASEEANWSGTALFAIKYVNLWQQYRTSNLIGWKLEVGVVS